MGQQDLDVSTISKRVHAIFDNIQVLMNAKSAKEIDEKPLKFPKIVTPPWRTTKNTNDPDLFTEVELSRQRNKLNNQLNEIELKQKKYAHKSKEHKKMKRMQVDNVKLIEEFNELNHENKKIKDHQKLIEMFLETVLGPENFEKMLASIDNDAIMGRTVKCN